MDLKQPRTIRVIIMIDIDANQSQLLLRIKIPKLGTKAATDSKIIKTSQSIANIIYTFIINYAQNS